jgi:hypothetical protein
LVKLGCSHRCSRHASIVSVNAACLLNAYRLSFEEFAHDGVGRGDGGENTHFTAALDCIGRLQPGW